MATVVTARVAAVCKSSGVNNTNNSLAACPLGLTCVPDIQEAACLSTLAVHSDGVAHCGLNHEAVESCAEDAVIIVTVDQGGVGCGLLSAHTIHNTLHAEAQHNTTLHALPPVALHHSIQALNLVHQPCWLYLLK